jgi:putative ABC transport system permease protein
MIREQIRIAIAGLFANKLRSALTVLGMTIGVGSVIVLISVGTGSSAAVQQRIQALGTNVLLVQRPFQRGGSSAGPATPPLTLTAAQALQNPDTAPAVQAVASVVNVNGATMVHNGTSYSPATFIGTTPAYLTAHTYDIAYGTGLTQADVNGHVPAIVLGPTVVSNLFGGQNPIGQTIQVNGSNFQVVGVTQPKGSNGAQDQDDIAIAPISAVQDVLTGYGSINSITVQAKSQSQLTAAQNEVTAILEQQLGTTAANPGFNVINQGTILSASQSTSGVFTTLLGVTERTREIGIRKAIGARPSDILTQFLSEAVLLAVCGAVLGVALGVLGSQLTIAGVKPVIAPYSIFLAFGAAVAIGLFFGTYPASRAAALQPIEALRFE